MHHLSSPPSSMPKPSFLWRAIVGLNVGGRKSKLSLRLVAVPGVLPATGVRVHCGCAGLGVTLTKSEKLKFVFGVVGPPKPKSILPLVPGVMCDEGSGVDLQGGVEGGWVMAGLMVMLLPAEGELAR